jgi:hypothetical protein
MNIVDGTVQTTYLVDEHVVSWDDFASYLTPSQRNASKPNGGTVSIKAQSVTVL